MVKALSFFKKKKFPGSRKNLDSWKYNNKTTKAQMKIQQMAFMIVAVFFFFMLVGLFFISWQLKSLSGSFESLQREQALSSLAVITNMPELNCDSKQSFCLDADKLSVIEGYDEFWPVASIKVYKIYPAFEESGKIKCPASDCNYWEVYDSGQTNVQEFASYVSICKKVKEFDYIYDRCEIGKILVGVKLNEN